MGRDAALESKAAILRRAAAEGHRIGNHTHSHRIDFAALDREAMRREIEEAQKAIGAAVGAAPVTFRSPGYNMSSGLMALLREAGLPCPRVSAGSTPTATHARSYDGLTEVRPGVYVFMDLDQAGIGACAMGDIAVSVLASVIGHYPHRNEALIDAGALALSKDISAQEFMPDSGYGTLKGFDDDMGVVIGRRLADQLSLRSGDNITLVAPRGAVTPMGTTPRIKVYKIAAVFEIGMSEYDSAMVFMPLKEAQAYFNRAGDVTAIEIYTDNPDRVDRYRKPVQDAAQRPVFMIDWRQRNATFFNALQVERNVMFLILTLIVLVAALNIVSGLIMLVKDKGQDIAILRTMGATQGAIMRVFLITGASIGVVGTIVGFLLGIVICLNIESIRQFLSWLTNTELFSPELYFLSHLPAQMDSGETTAVVVMALMLSLLATLYPSWRAARLDPVEALRYE